MQVLKGWQAASDHLFSMADDALQSGDVLEGRSSISNGDEGGDILCLSCDILCFLIVEDKGIHQCIYIGKLVFNCICQ